jgi:hypothetical protein
VIKDQKQPVTGATLVRGADLPVELGVLIDASSHSVRRTSTTF